MKKPIVQFRSGWPGRRVFLVASNGGISLAHPWFRTLRIPFNNKKGRYVFTERFPSLGDRV